MAIQWVPHGLVHAVVHHSRRVWDRAGVRVARAKVAARIMARGRCCRHRGRIVDLCLLHRRVLHYGSIISVNFTVLSSAKDITQLVFGSFQNALLLLWKIFAGAIDVEI